MKHPTRQEIAGSFNLWGEYVDPQATMTEDEFNKLTAAEKIEMQRQIWPTERMDEDEDE